MQTRSLQSASADRSVTRNRKQSGRQIELLDRAGNAAGKQFSTLRRTACGNVLPCTVGAACVRYPVPAIYRAYYQHQLQRAGGRRRHHPAVFLLRRRCDHYAAVFHSSCVFSGSSGGILGEIQTPANTGCHDHSLGPHRHYGCRWLRPWDPGCGFHRRLAEVPRPFATPSHKRARQDSGNRGSGFTDCAGRRSCFVCERVFGTKCRAHAHPTWDRLVVCSLSGSHLRAFSRVFHAGRKASGVARDLAAFSRIATDTGQGDPGRRARRAAGLPGGNELGDSPGHCRKQPILLGARDGVSRADGDCLRLAEHGAVHWHRPGLVAGLHDCTCKMDQCRPIRVHCGSVDHHSPAGAKSRRS